MIEKMIQQGTIVVPTYVAAFEACRDPERSLIKEDELQEYVDWKMAEEKNLPRAFEKGVKVGAGSDAGFPLLDFTAVIRELELLVALGSSPLQALQAATITAAEGVGQADRLGAIEPGKLADMVILSENPLDDISAVRSVKIVFKDGEIVRPIRESEVPDPMWRRIQVLE